MIFPARPSPPGVDAVLCSILKKMVDGRTTINFLNCEFSGLIVYKRLKSQNSGSLLNKKKSEDKRGSSESALRA